MAEEKITILGTVASEPVQDVAWNGIPLVKFRLATNIQRFDRRIGGYTQNQINWYTVICFNRMGLAVMDNVGLKDRIIVTGVLKVVSTDNEGKQVVELEVEAEGIGLDLAYDKRALRLVE